MPALATTAAGAQPERTPHHPRWRGGVVVCAGALVRACCARE